MAHDACVICLEVREESYFLACLHGFHLKCIQGHLQWHLNCPTCRYPISAEVMDDICAVDEEDEEDSETDEDDDGETDDDMASFIVNDVDSEDSDGEWLP